MKTEILFCIKCNIYTLRQQCPSCNNTVFSPKPPRYSPLDKWGEWRRKAKKEIKN